MIILPMLIDSKYAPDIPTICIAIVYFILDLVCVGGTIALGYFAADSFIKNELPFGGLFIFLGLMMAAISIITVAITIDTIKDIKKERREKLAKLAWKQQAKKKTMLNACAVIMGVKQLKRNSVKQHLKVRLYTTRMVTT